MEVGAREELRDIGADEMLCRQIIRPRMESSALKQFEPDVAFPGAFIFQERADQTGLLRRLESLYWLSLSDEATAHAIGEAKAEKDRQAQLVKNPAMPESDQYQYGGLLLARADEIREIEAFEVRHLPEDGVYEHVEIELMPSCTVRMNQKAQNDGGVIKGPLNDKNARRMAVSLLLQVFHVRGHLPPPNDRGGALLLA